MSLYIVHSRYILIVYDLCVCVCVVADLSVVATS